MRWPWGYTDDTNLGSALAVGDIDGDGFDDFVAGHPRRQVCRSSELDDYGAVLIAYGPHSTGKIPTCENDLEPRGMTVIRGEGEDGEFGRAVAISAGDPGEAVWVIGAGTKERGGASNSGVVSIYDVQMGRWMDEERHARTRIEGEHNGDLFGYALLGGDIDGDGLPDVVITAVQADNGADNAGEIAVFYSPPEGRAIAS